LQCIFAAQATLLLALPMAGQEPRAGSARSGDGLFNGEAPRQLINKHFDLDNWPHPADNLHELYRLFSRMAAVFQRPGGLWGPAIFDMNPSTDLINELAFTYKGGYHLQGQKDGRGLRKDTIYLCEGLVHFGTDQCILTIVHELAHYAGCFPPLMGAIHDHGYGWIDDPRMLHLNPWQKMHNAESFANFAFDAAYHRVPSDA
jgi:hypothetical protein